MVHALSYRLTHKQPTQQTQLTPSPAPHTQDRAGLPSRGKQGTEG